MSIHFDLPPLVPEMESHNCIFLRNVILYSFVQLIMIQFLFLDVKSQKKKPRKTMSEIVQNGLLLLPSQRKATDRRATI